MMKTAVAVRRGTGHLLQELPCQDSAAGRSNAPCAAVALCDGAGSRKHSERGAQRLSSWAAGWLPEVFDQLYELQTDEIAAHILREGLAQLDELGMTPDECLCTFLAFARHEDGRWIAAHIGDGYIFAPDRVLSYPENGLYANETYFFSGPYAERHLRVFKGWDSTATAVLLTSDGCGDVLYDRSLDCPAPAVQKLCAGLAVHTPQEAEEALAYNLAEVFAARSDDDLSLALLWCSAPVWEQERPEDEPERREWDETDLCDSGSP